MSSSALSTFQFINKYARFDRRTNRRETWDEAQDRVIAFMRSRVGGLTVEDWDHLREMAGGQKSLWAMRVLQMAGPSAERCNVGLYNCAYTPIERIRDFSDALYILMQGTGVGFSVEREYVNRLPVVEHPLVYDWAYPPVHTIADSTEGWCDALRLGLEAWWSGKDVVFDYSAIRPAGSPLLTKGGRASGPEPLRELLTFARGIIRRAAGRRLSSLEAHRIACKIGRIVEVGGVRRAAMLSLSDLDDAEMRGAKDGAFWEGAPELTMANNSVAYNGRPSAEDFWKEWETLARSGSGERGIFNRESREKRARVTHGLAGTNPCVTADTWIATSAGPRQVKSLLTAPYTAVVAGKKYPATAFWMKGEKEVLRVNTVEGYALRATGNHEVYTTRGKVAVHHLVPGDKILVDFTDLGEWEGTGWSEAQGWLLGNLYGDGTVSSDTAILAYWGDNMMRMMNHAQRAMESAGIPRRSDCGSSDGAKDKVRLTSKGLRDLAVLMGMTQEDKRPDAHRVEGASAAFYRGFLSGWFDADGCIQGTREKGYSARLCCVDRGMLEMAQRMLARMGMYSRIYKRQEAGVRRMPDGKGGTALYPTQAVYELVVSARSLRVFIDSFTFANPKHTAWASEIRARGWEPYSDKGVARVVSVIHDGMEDVFDCSVADVNRYVANGLVISNCGEIKLNPRQFCNLTIAVVRNTDTRDDLRAKVRAAAIMGTVQAACTDFRYIDKKWRETTESERLLGVDLLGALDNPHTRDGDFLVELRELVVATNAEYADRIGIPRSTATTCIKPAGNSGVLLGTGNSVTGWYARYFWRRVRVNKVDPMFQFLAEQGVPWDEEYHDPRIAVFAFPQAAPEGVILRSDRTALEQLEWWRTLQTAWAEHSVSATIYVRSDEWRSVGQWVWDNWDDVTGIAFLPHSDANYPLAPLEEMSSREEYLRAVARFPTIDWSAFSERDGGEDNTKMEFACTAGGCEI